MTLQQDEQQVDEGEGEGFHTNPLHANSNCTKHGCCCDKLVEMIKAFLCESISAKKRGNSEMKFIFCQRASRLRAPVHPTWLSLLLLLSTPKSCISHNNSNLQV